MNNKRFIAPSFLEKLDRWLLLNKPEGWSARTHLVAWYGGICIALIALVAYLFPDDPRSETGAFNWLMFTVIITIIAVVAWLIYLLRFNVFKRYGITSGLQRLQTLVLYFLAAGIIMLIPFVHLWVESEKAATAFPGEVVVKDVNAFNLALAHLEYDSFKHTWDRDTVTVRDTLPGHYLREKQDNQDVTVVTVTEEYDAASDTMVTIATPPLIKKGLIDTATLRIRLAGADSVIRMNDSMYITLSCPKYVLLYAYNADDYTDTALLSSPEIYHRVIEHYSPPDKAALSATLQQVVTKYYLERPYGYYYSSDPQRTLEKKYHIDNLERSISNILERTDRWKGSNLSILFRIWFYHTLVIALLVFMFRHSTVRTFFLTLLAVAVISILNGLFLALLNFTASNFFIVVLCWFIVFTVCSFATFAARTRNFVTGIGLNLFVLMIYFVPLLSTGLYISILDERNRARGKFSHDDHDYGQWLFYAEIAGGVLLLVLAATVIHRLYRKWYALPEQ